MLLNFRDRDRVLGLLVFLLGRLGENDKGDGNEMWGKMGVKRDDLEQQKQNPSLTCTLTFVSKIHMNFSFQNDDI